MGLSYVKHEVISSMNKYNVYNFLAIALKRIVRIISESESLSCRDVLELISFISKEVESHYSVPFRANHAEFCNLIKYALRQEDFELLLDSQTISQLSFLYIKSPLDVLIISATKDVPEDRFIKCLVFSLSYVSEEDVNNVWYYLISYSFSYLRNLSPKAKSYLMCFFAHRDLSPGFGSLFLR